MPDYYVAPIGVPQSLPTNEEVILPAQCVSSAMGVFNKGYTPPPFELSLFDTGNGIRITFEQSPSLSDCMCAIECVGTAELLSEPFCPSQTSLSFDTTVSVVDEGNVVELSFTFSDALGNSTVIEANSLVFTKPSTMLRVVLQESSYYFVELGIPFTSVSGEDLRQHVYQYQVESYVGNVENKSVLIDWTKANTISSSVSITQRLDNLIRVVLRASNLEYGFRVRYRTVFDDASKWSDWVTAKAPNDVQT